MNSLSEQVSWLITFAGRVQGVGFRYTASSIAQRFAVCGFVKNMANGTVEMGLAGSKADCEQVLRELRAAMSGNIETEEREPWEYSEGLERFVVRY